jgi:hypothetical protein
MQSKIDSIKASKPEYIVSIPIQSNFIRLQATLGMSVQEIDRLEYRKGNKYVNSKRISSSYTSF